MKTCQICGELENTGVIIHHYKYNDEIIQICNKCYFNFLNDNNIRKIYHEKM